MRQAATHTQTPFPFVQRPVRRRRFHVVARAVAADVAKEPAGGAEEKPSTFEPEEMVLEAGELSPINRNPSDEAFTCTGCTDMACQVLHYRLSAQYALFCSRLFRGSCSAQINWKPCRARQVATRQLGGLMTQGICGQCLQLVYTM